MVFRSSFQSSIWSITPFENDLEQGHSVSVAITCVPTKNGTFIDTIGLFLDNEMNEPYMRVCHRIL